MSRSALLVFGGLALLGIAIGSLATSAQQPKVAPQPEALFGKPVLVLTKRDASVTLEQGRIRNLGGRQFVVGKEMKDSPYTRERFGGGTVWVPLEDVTELVELPDAEKGK